MNLRFRIFRIKMIPAGCEIPKNGETYSKYAAPARTMSRHRGTSRRFLPIYQVLRIGRDDFLKSQIRPRTERGIVDQSGVKMKAGKDGVPEGQPVVKIGRGNVFLGHIIASL
jgi:hypothetical protein